MIRHSVFGIAIVLLAGHLASAQPPALTRPASTVSGTAQTAPSPPPMTNLQIFPKDTPRPQLVGTMQAISASLGVQCVYCHVQEGRGGRNDFASDEKPTKKAARGMLVLAREINAKLPEAVGKSADATTRVGCATCHRGVPIPKQITDIVTDAAASGGASAGLARFKELRAQFYGGQSYDFSEGSLVAIAQRANTAKKPADALAYLNANLEYFPKSARTYAMIGQVKNGTGDKAGAIQALEKAVELDPNNAQAKAQLEALQK
jgi:hypothetical protein